ncbi:uncharacterized protein EDB91DRAFT_1088025 [Suillus paluster]|uniref:uncharacterized protein n=1 Tax=Suillus paluster TaxID=48578 RepID=UPI001B85CB29|nr:uncharacterized protein EDB91DRAFT_1088025 [Suillus paluster]KAG1722730.1 hypothetical protein EDB91DRAFT_1088025 [Suillus paluster]
MPLDKSRVERPPGRPPRRTIQCMSASKRRSSASGVDDSDDDESDHDDDDTTTNGRSLSHGPNALSHLPAASRWINRGQIFPDTLPLPDDLRQLCAAILTIPDGMLTSLLPRDDISVASLINHRLPQIAMWPFDQSIQFDEDLPTATVDPQGQIPPVPYIERLGNEFGQALLDGKRSIRDPRNLNTLLPLWVIEFWWALHSAHEHKTHWVKAARWIREKQKTGRDLELFREAETLLRLLPWNRSLRGPAATSRRTTNHLRLFLSDHRCLSETLVDLMTASLVSFLPVQRHDVIIANTSFGDAICRAKHISYHNRPHRHLQEIEDDAKKHRYLYATVHVPTLDHFIAFAIDFETKSFKYGDSLYSKNAPSDIIQKLQWWFCKRFGGEFRNDGGVLPHGVQKDTCCCALFAINTVAHNVLGHTLGVPHPASDRARWFSVIARSQIEDPQVVQREMEQRLEEERQEEERQEKERMEQVRLEQERQEKETTEKERQEKERLEQEQRQEKERLEQERQEKERMEQVRLEQERQEKARLEQERQEKDRLEQERQEKARLEQERQEKERMEQVRLEQERQEKVRLEQERQENERLEQERWEQERMEQDVIMADDAHENDQHMHVDEYRPPAMAHSSPPEHELEPGELESSIHNRPLLSQHNGATGDRGRRRSHDRPHPIGTIRIVDPYLPLVIAAHGHPTETILPLNRTALFLLVTADHALRLDTNRLRATRVLEGVAHPPPLIRPHHAITFKERVLQLAHRAILLRLPNSRLLLMNHPVAQTDKTRWIIARTSHLVQFDKPTAVNLSMINHPSYRSLHVISRGRLVVSKRTELRLRLWRDQYPDVPLWFFAVRCISRGLDWRVFVSSYNLIGPNPAYQITPPPYISATHPPLANDTLQEYEYRVRALLQLPYARRFLTMGGIVWRVALHYGPPSLFSAALSGPSIDAYMHHRVDRVGSDIDDTVTPDAVALLLGTSLTGRSVWPPHDTFERFQKWHGEWSEGWEDWFNKRITALYRPSMQTPAQASFLTRKAWVDMHRKHTIIAFQSSGTDGTDAQAARLCEELCQAYPSMESYNALP